jgi:putative ABC transport system permease protein
MVLALKSAGDPRALVGAVREEIRRVDPLQAVSEVRTLEEVVADQLSSREFYTSLVGTFAALAVLLACAGVFGVLAHQVAARTREIGIRTALGAEEGTILRQILGEAMLLAGGGLTVGLAGVLASGGVLQSLLYGVGTLDPITLVAGASGLLAASLLAALLPARRASRVDPALVLKGE